MSPERFNECLRVISWTPINIASALQCELSWAASARGTRGVELRKGWIGFQRINIDADGIGAQYRPASRTRHEAAARWAVDQAGLGHIEFRQWMRLWKLR